MAARPGIALQVFNALNEPNTDLNLLLVVVQMYHSHSQVRENL